MVTGQDYLNKNPQHIEGLLENPFEKDNYLHYKVIDGDLFFKMDVTIHSEPNIQFTTKFTRSLVDNRICHWVLAGIYLNNYVLVNGYKPFGDCVAYKFASKVHSLTARRKYRTDWLINNQLRVDLLQEFCWYKLFTGWVNPGDITTILDMDTASRSILRRMFQELDTNSYMEQTLDSIDYVDEEYEDLTGSDESEWPTTDDLIQSSLDSMGDFFDGAALLESTPEKEPYLNYLEQVAKFYSIGDVRESVSNTAISRILYVLNSLS